MDISDKVKNEYLEMVEKHKNAKPDEMITIKSRMNVREYIEEPQEESQDNKTIKTV